MAYDFGAATTDGISWAAGAGTLGGGNTTVSFWYRRDDTPAVNEVMFAVSNSGATKYRYIYSNNTGGVFAYFGCTGSPAYKQATTAAFPTLNTWVNIIVTDDGSLTASNVGIYYDNVAQTHALDENGGTAQASLDGSWYLGAAGAAGSCDGKIAFPAVWNVVLDASERAALAKGMNPRLVRTQSLLWAPDITRNAIDPISGITGTITGASVYDNPRIIMPHRRGIRRFTTAAAGGLAAHPMRGGGAAANPLWGYAA